MLDIHIQPTDDEQYQKVLDTLRPMGVRLVTGEADPLVAALFYVALINTKLDNLGQLSHINKIRQSLSAIEQQSKEADEYYKHLNKDIQEAKLRKRRLWSSLREKTGEKPVVQGDLDYMTEKEIVRLFESYLPEDDYSRMVYRARG